MATKTKETVDYYTVEADCGCCWVGGDADPTDSAYMFDTEKEAINAASEFLKMHSYEADSVTVSKVVPIVRVKLSDVTVEKL